MFIQRKKCRLHSHITLFTYCCHFFCIKILLVPHFSQYMHFARTDMELLFRMHGNYICLLCHEHFHRMNVATAMHLDQSIQLLCMFPFSHPYFILSIIATTAYAWNSTYIILSRIFVTFFILHSLTLKVLNFWKFTSYCSLKPLWSGMGEVVPARTSPTLHPPSHINCRE